MLTLDLNKAIAAIKARKAKTVAVQAPEGLKTRLAGIVQEIETKTGATVFSFLDPCFGACDIADEKAKALGADLLLHFGHTQFVSKHAIETVYLPLGYELDRKKLPTIVNTIAKELGKKKAKKVVLCSTAQFLPYLKELKEELEKKKISAFISKGKNVQLGQVLGCNYTAVKSVESKADATVFFGDGLFHPLGIAFSSNKPVFVADPLEGEVKEIGQQKDMFLRKRIAMIEKTKQAKLIAIWVSSKPGQNRMKLALQLKRKAEAKGKKAIVFVSDFINPEYFLGIDAGAIVNTACPRIALDDSSSYKQPIVNASEFLIALGEKSIDDYKVDELV